MAVSKRIKLLLGFVVVVFSSIAVVIVLLRSEVFVKSIEFKRMYEEGSVKVSDQVQESLLSEYGKQEVANWTKSCPHPLVFHSWRQGVVTQVGPPLQRDCHRLRQNPVQEANRSHLDLQLEKWRANSPWVSLALMYQQMSCDEMRKEFGSSFYVSKTEKTFPIAYMLVVYDSPGQILRLLKSIYRPHNLYCIHPDARQGRKFREFFGNIVNCLDNVFVVSQQIKIYYEHISITDAQLNCMQDLEKYPGARWKYVINLCGKEIPLKTNREIVEYLQMLKGYSAVNAYPLPEVHRRQRFTYKFHLDGHGNNRQTWEKQATPPTSVPLYKSANFIAASRAFTHFLLHDPRSRELHDYLISVRDPEEIFYASLYALPSAVGARAPTEVMDKSDVPTVDAFIWVTDSTEKKYSHIICPGQKIVHDICILTALEMQRIEKSVVTKHVFFFNKYYLEWDPTPMDCMEERLVETNIEEYKRDCLPQHSQEKAPYGC